MNKQEKEYIIERFFDEMQAHIVLAGGAKLSIKDLHNMTLYEALCLLTPNRLVLTVHSTEQKGVIMEVINEIGDIVKWAKDALEADQLDTLEWYLDEIKGIVDRYNYEMKQ